MQRVLEFPVDHPKSVKRFELCRTAILQAGDGKGPRDRQTVRQEARLLDAFDAISTPDATAATCPTCGATKTLCDRQLTGGTITLAGEDFTLLTKYLDTTPWLPRFARDAVDVQDFADAAEKVD